MVTVAQTSEMNVDGQNAVVVGAGRTGVAAAELLARNGAKITLSDSDVPGNVSCIRRALSEWEIDLELGAHKVGSFTNAELIVLSPGVPRDIEPVLAAERAGVPVMSELEMAWRFSDSRLVGVTGTNGKTTVTMLIHRMIKEAGFTVILAGNNEFPLSAAVMARPSPEFLVVEVSSFALERVETFHPEVAVLLNVTPDHMERYIDLDDYRRTKIRIFERQDPSDTAILNGDDPQIRKEAAQVRAKKLFFSLEGEVDNGVFVSEGVIVGMSRGDRRPLARVDDLALAGTHNRANALAALGVSLALDLPEEARTRVLGTFTGLEHRMEFVAEKDGVTFINDSKATNLDALKKALMSMESPVVLIAGGRGKGSDYSMLRDLVRARVKSLVLVGEDAPVIEDALGELVPVTRAGSLEEAVCRAFESASKGNCVLLSPACASFDMFRNFEERGERFREAVNSL